MRTNNLTLPDTTELWHILSVESQRLAVHYDYLPDHDTEIFEALRALAAKARVSVEWATDYGSTPLDNLVPAIATTTRALAGYIQAHPDVDYTKLYDSLSPSAKPHQSDGIFVFGSPTDVRIKKAIELYNEGLAPKIIISGHGPHYARPVQTEAARMGEIALNAGVPQEAILLEETSVTLPDNVKRSLDMFEGDGWQPQRLIVIAAPFVLRRAHMEWYKFTPWDITIFPISPTPLSAAFAREAWHQNTAGVAMLLNEYAKLVIESKIDLVRRDNEQPHQ